MNHYLYTRSINVIRENQSEWGSYIASPSFPTYHFCWLRDSSFIAYAMDKAGEHESAVAYFRWVNNTILSYGGKISEIRQKLAKGLPLGKDEVLHTRFSLDGKEDYADDTWGNFQVDGYGTWLWALSEHVRMTNNHALLQELSPSIELTLQYLELVWETPNYDCWEEHPDYLHPYSLAAVYGGVQAVSDLIFDGFYTSPSVAVAQLAANVKAFVHTYGISDGKLVKMINPSIHGDSPQPVTTHGLDASLMAAVLPYGLLALDDPTALATMEAIEAELLRPGGGVYRYLLDVYYGGGEWLLLTAWLGWYFAKIGRMDDAQALCSWIESCADERGNLPEQVSEHVLFPDHNQPWVNKWGPIASPLLWSHAMYILLVKAIEEGKIQ